MASQLSPLTFLPPLPVWSLVVMAALAVGAAVIDIRTHKVPNWLTLPVMAAAVAGHALAAQLGGDAEPLGLGLGGSLAGLAAGLTPLAACWLFFGTPGGGDVKLMGAFGALGGWEFAVRAMFYGFAAGALMAAAIMIHRGLVRQTLRRMWLMLVMIVTGQAKSVDTVLGTESPTIPFAVALSIGAVAAGAETVIRANWSG